ncbi:centrosomal protein of 95 kDa-like isoform X2 [Acanthaster planci]|uniref:Centrosomal protein of 95 kDa-like isoform X2 n=1 Tax=Acanthaster planci TaxID=133434 RepID=A0A8B7YJA4_ACAPL|nr:centrosomal protein of 95 kDa-like isoform X2 [Acanthaster planci]
MATWDYSSYKMDSNRSKDDTAIANELLRRVNLPSVKDLSECTSSVFVALCEGILGDPLKGVSYVPVTKEDEIHNVQLVVDHLADKVLHCDLSHISGRAVVEGNRVAIQYLLEILLGVMDYIMEGIESEGSTTDNEDPDDLQDDLMDPDTLTRGTVSAITDVLRQELGPRGKDDYDRPTVTQYDRPPYDSYTISDISKHLSQPNSQSEGESTAELIKLGTEDPSQDRHRSLQRDTKTDPEPPKDAPLTSGPVGQSLDDHQTRMSNLLPTAMGEMPAVAPSSPPPAGTVDSTTDSPSRQRDKLTVQDLTGSSFSSVSWPKPPASTHQLPSEFDSLGVRPRPAITKDRPAAAGGYGLGDSLVGSLKESGSLPQHHVHTHHHYHQPVGKPSSSPTRSKSPPHATLSRPPASEGTSPAKLSPPRELDKRKEPRVAPSWHERFAGHDDITFDDITGSRPRHTYPATLRSTYPALSRRRPSSSPPTRVASVEVPPAEDGYQPPRKQRTIYSKDAEHWPGDRLNRREEGHLPPRPRRVAFVDDYDERDRSQRSFFREKLEPVTSRFMRESSESEADSDSDALSQCSDTAVDYQQGTNYKQTHYIGEQRDQPYHLRPRRKPAAAASIAKKQRPQLRPKSVLLPVARTRSHRVRFEEALEADATGPMSRIRKRLNKENRKHSRQKEVLRYVYKSNLEEAKSGLKKQLDRNKKVLNKQDAEYRKVFSGPKTSNYQPAQKYNVTTERPSRAATRGLRSKRKRSASASPTMHRHKRLSIGEDEMLPTVMQEFPFLHVSPQTAHDMWAKQMRQMEQLTKMGVDQQYKKTKTQLKREEAEKRQEILLRIMKKELAHNQRMREIRERRSNEQAMQRQMQEQRQVNARARRYYDEFQLRARSRLMKRRTREEQIFKKLFEDGLNIQKARIRDLRKYAREKREEAAKRQQDEIDSLENYYRNQFSMLAEAISKERHDLQTRDRAQTKVMEGMKRDMRRKMEQEVRVFQEQMYRDEDTEYFRQLEADRMRRELQMASYKTVI